MLYSRTLLSVALAALGAGVAAAADEAPNPASGVERDYVFDISGGPARTGLTGDCVYTRVYSAEGVRPSCLNQAAAQEAPPAAADAVAAGAPQGSESRVAEETTAPSVTQQASADRDLEAERAAAQAAEAEAAAARAADEAAAARAADEAAAARAADEAAARSAAEAAAARAAAEAAAAEQARNAPPAPPPEALAMPEEALPAPTRPAVTDRAPAIKTVSLDTETLFAFDRAVITPPGRQRLDAFVAELADLEYGTIHVTGHADRIGADAYNVGLSRERAEAVKRYLAEQGIDAQKIEARGVGSSEPVTQAGACEGLKRTSLIDCLHPDRRVEVEVVAQREE
jgi:outer membrane protein OmpA-like peptidoglycan-associated protein